jgi:hypothetical protein
MEESMEKEDQENWKASSSWFYCLGHRPKKPKKTKNPIEILRGQETSQSVTQL